MKRMTAATVACMIEFFIVAPAMADNPAPITGVVLYPNSATLERTVHVTPGMAQVEIRKLPANFDIQTLRVDADSGIRIGQIVTQDTAQAANKDSRQAEIEAKIQMLQDQQATLDNDIKSAELIRNYLGRLGENSISKQGMDGKSLSGLLDTMRHESGDALGRIQHANMQKREIAKKIDALNRDLERIRSEASDLRDLTVQVDAQKAGKIRLSYQVGDTGWRPAYRATLDSLSSKVRLERMGTLFQKTGEDWSGVKVRLSTGYPNTSPQAADPQPWRISYTPPPPPPHVYRASLQSSYAEVVTAEDVGKMPDKNVADSLQRLPGVTLTPTLIESAFATEFEAPGVVNLPADGREISILLSEDTIPVAQKIRVAPRLDKTAVVTAEAERMEGVWVPGDIQLFRDGSYVGASSWNPQSSQGFVFSFGRDDLVRVKVDHGKDRSGTTGVLSRQSERRVSDTYTISSSHKTPVDLLVLESSPLSSSDEVKVTTAFKPEPTQKNWNEKPGVMAWEKTLSPGETYKIDIDYAVSYPKEGTTNGLP